jgi:hypothetical protein
MAETGERWAPSKWKLVRGGLRCGRIKPNHSKSNQFRWDFAAEVPGENTPWRTLAGYIGTRWLAGSERIKVIKPISVGFRGSVRFLPSGGLDGRWKVDHGRDRRAFGPSRWKLGQGVSGAGESNPIKVNQTNLAGFLGIISSTRRLFLAQKAPASVPRRHLKLTAAWGWQNSASCSASRDCGI